MATLIGSAPYIYVCTRLRVRRAKLIPRDEYIRMLNMSLPEITRLIQETEYKGEIDELSSSFSGINLLEIALSWNLAKTYQNVMTITPGTLQEMTRSYLRRWDIQNVLTILRGKDQRLPKGRIKEVLIPAGELDREFLDRLIAEETNDTIVAALKDWRLYPVLTKEYPAAIESGSFSRLENELYKQFYTEIIIVGQTVKGGVEFLEYINLDIDVRNLQNLFRLRTQGERGDIGEYLIPGGTFSVDELLHISSIDSLDEFIAILEKKLRGKPLLSILENLKKNKALNEGVLQENEIALTRLQIAQMGKMSKLHPFSIWPVLAYLELKKYEIFNLRAITRGKEANLPMEMIKRYLVM